MDLSVSILKKCIEYILGFWETYNKSQEYVIGTKFTRDVNPKSRTGSPAEAIGRLLIYYVKDVSDRPRE